jgi:ABC-type phosphate transport system permease subunit
MTIWARGRFGSAMLALALALVTSPIMAQAQQKVLRVVPQGEVKVFDPH